MHVHFQTFYLLIKLSLRKTKVQIVISIIYISTILFLFCLYDYKQIVLSKSVIDA